jgi:hypothetical protein
MCHVILIDLNHTYSRSNKQMARIMKFKLQVPHNVFFNSYNSSSFLWSTYLSFLSLCFLFSAIITVLSFITRSQCNVHSANVRFSTLLLNKVAEIVLAHPWTGHYPALCDSKPPDTIRRVTALVFLLRSQLRLFRVFANVISSRTNTCSRDS